MTEKNPIEPLLDKIAELLQIFEANRSSTIQGEPSDGELALMGSLVLQVEAMQEAYLVALKAEGMTDDDVKKVLQGSRTELREKDRKLLERIERMKKEIEYDQLLINKAIEERRRKTGKTGVPIKGGKTKRLKDVAIGFRKQWKKM